MSIKKQVLKSKPICKVSFKVEKSEAQGAAKVSVVGDFNNWDEVAGEMKALKDGSFSTTLEVETGRDYRFRYVADGERWFNDPESDNFEVTEYGDSENSVINL